jgi:hypothetical protein
MVWSFLGQEAGENCFPDIHDENGVQQTHFWPLINNYLKKNKIPVRDFVNISREQMSFENDIQW